MIRFTVERVVRASPAELYGWMSDYSDRDYTGPNWSPKEGVRRSVSEQDAQYAVFTDFYGRTTLNYRATKQPPFGVEVEGVGTNMNAHVSLKVSPVTDGSKLVVEFRFEPQGAAKLFAGLMSGAIVRATTRQVDSFLADLSAVRTGTPRDS